MKKGVFLLVALLAAPAEASIIPGFNLPGVSLVSPTLNLSFGQASGSILLPATLKDPFAAFNLTTVPFIGSFYAAGYVGTSPLEAEADPALQNAALHHFCGDLLFLASGFLIPLLPGNPLSSYAGWTGGGLAIGGPLLVRLLFHGPFFANQSVAFNRRQYNEFNYRPWFDPISTKKQKGENAPQSRPPAAP